MLFRAQKSLCSHAKATHMANFEENLDCLLNGSVGERTLAQWLLGSDIIDI